MEVIRRYFKAKCDARLGTGNAETAQQVHLLLKELDIWPHDLPVVTPALEKAQACGTPTMAMMLADGKIITGRNSTIMNAAAATVINACKYLTGIPDDVHLLSPLVLGPIFKLKASTLADRNPILNLEEVLIALSVSTATNPMIELAMSKLGEMAGCEAHSSVMLGEADERILRKLKVNYTAEPVFATESLCQGD